MDNPLAWQQNGAFAKDLPLQLAWDSTSLGAFKQCPRYYQYAIVEGWTAHDPNIHLTFGIVYHSALEHYDRAKTSGASHTEALRIAVHHALSATWHGGKPWFSEDDRKNRLTLIRTIIWYLDQFQNDPISTVILANGKPALELSFRFETEIQSPFGPYSLCGHLDRLGVLGNDTYVCDRKTTGHTLGQDYFDGYSPDNQFSLYTLASQIVYGAKIKGIIIDAAQVAVSFSRFLRGFVARTPDQISEWYEDLQHWLAYANRCATLGHWPMNDKACFRCQFRQICSSSPNVREKWLRVGFKRRVWDPTIARGDI